MRRPRKSQKERGVVLLLILAFMAMFAVMILTFIMVTTNMSESGNPAETASSGAVVPTSEETSDAIKTLMIGSRSNVSPIGPFSLMENLYGHTEDLYNLNDRYFDDNSADFSLMQVKTLEFGYDGFGLEVYFDTDNFTVQIWPHERISIEADDSDYNDKRPLLDEFFSHIIESSGSMLTFGAIPDKYDESNDEGRKDVIALWNNTLANHSFVIVDKAIITNENLQGFSGTPIPTYCELKIQPTESLLGFVREYEDYISRRHLENPPVEVPRLYFDDDDDGFCDFALHYDIPVRLNAPAAAGTGAGGFSPLSALDGQQIPSTNSGAFNLPFAWWANAAAPDLTPFDSDAANGETSTDFHSYLKHLADRCYKPFSYNDAAPQKWMPYFQAASGNIGHWEIADYINTLDTAVPADSQVANTESVRMNPSYTAADGRNLFLSWYNKPPIEPNTEVANTFIPLLMVPHPSDATVNIKMAEALPENCTPNEVDSTLLKDTPGVKIIPSFHRPSIFGEFARKYLNAAEAGTNGVENWPADSDLTLGKWPNIDLLSIVRKMTPRPLALDHWNFSGGNPGLPALDSEDKNQLNAVDGSDYTIQMNNKVVSLLGFVDSDGKQHYGSLQAPVEDDPDNPNYGYLSWDVDNDGDGIREGIWIPSGLPIRTAADGTPYATMYSFTVMDMDGRINVNTAGNWDQMRNFTYDRSPYDLLDDLVELRTTSAFPSPLPNDFQLSPWYDVELLRDNNDATADVIDWKDDMGELIDSDLHRGTGVGPASVNLTKALTPIFDEITGGGPPVLMTDAKAAANLLWNRHRSGNETETSNASVRLSAASLPLWNFRYRYGDLTDASAANQGTIPQPGVYLNPLTQTIDNNDDHIRFYRFTDPVYAESTSHTLTDAALPGKFLLPWRGKTRVISSEILAQYYPTYDFTDTKLRSYDPLGHDLLTYAPKQSENPYLLNPYVFSEKDAPYGAAFLERLLRPLDADIAVLPLELPNNLTGQNSGAGSASSRDTSSDYNSARLNLTTISSDIPVPATAFAVGPESDGDGVFGIRALIRKYVTVAFYEANKESTGLTGEISTALNAFDADSQHVYAGLSDEDKRRVDPERRKVRRTAIETWLTTNFGSKMDDLVEQLYNLLPDDSKAGRRLDLNALSRKACWMDLVNENGNVLVPDGHWASANDGTAFGDVHRSGLVERMNFARSLYMLLSVLTYADRHAGAIAGFYGVLDDSDNPALDDYVEGVDLGQFTDPANPTEEERKKADELFANRLAQWCVNFVDFSDPDATMTPLFYDPNPFDGWWTLDNDWMTKSYVSADETSWMIDVMKTGQVADFSLYLKNALGTPDTVSAPVFKFYNETTAALENLSYAGVLARLLETAEIYYYDTEGRQRKLTDGRETNGNDIGFRRVWGLERPDLALTETLNFHDLGIADTNNDSSGEKLGRYDQVDESEHMDDDYDQVRRPQGSTYLELYCTANPNIPQSPELYEYTQVLSPAGVGMVDSAGNAVKAWQLRISKKTPRVSDAASPYYTREFPVWRVAISACTAPRAEDTKDSAADNRQIRKHANSVLERLVGTNADFRTFSMQPRQFAARETGDVNAAWANLDIPASHLLGPSWVVDDSGDKDVSQEVELDRIVWFCDPTEPGTTTRDDPAHFPDGKRLFWRVRETGDSDHVDVRPNQYMVVGPEPWRSIGSYLVDSTYSGSSGYFGVPSENRIKLAELNPVNGVSMCAGSYYGIPSGGTFSYKRGLNISEPLWTSDTGTDPYPSGLTMKKETINGETIWVPDKEFLYVDEPFDRPSNWGAGSGTSPIAEDELFGVGTVAGYRSAFLQRVADPNRPYHPLTNPYLTVDWNMMDLTVFNGEAGNADERDNDTPFVCKSDDPNTHFLDANDKISNNNQFKFTGLTPEPVLGTDSLNLDQVFSSRQWGKAEQKVFWPTDTTPSLQTLPPNPWARALSVETSETGTTAGLEAPISVANLRKFDSAQAKWVALTAADGDMAVPYGPANTLGWYNNRGALNAGGTWFDGLETFWHDDFLMNNFFTSRTDACYLGSPKSDDDGGAKRLEHLVWNDAPMTNPAEILLVPAVGAGRFGLEFIRKAEKLELKQLYLSNETSGTGQTAGRSLGSSALSGTDYTNLFGYDFKKRGGAGGHSTGPYLNFLQSADPSIKYVEDPSAAGVFNWESGLGKSLNLGKMLDFVGVPSLYQGTKTLGKKWVLNTLTNTWEFIDETDDLGDPVYHSKLREPGKINVNTLREPAWLGLDVAAEFNDLFGMKKGRTLLADPADDTSAVLKDFVPFLPQLAAPLYPYENETKKGLLPGDFSYFAAQSLDPSGASEKTPLLNRDERGNLRAMTDEIQKLSNLTTTRSNVFAVWLTVGYFEVEKVVPGVNVPGCDPEGQPLVNNSGDPLYVDQNGNNTTNMSNAYSLKMFFNNSAGTGREYKYSNYYHSIYPDGYTYGRELGSDNLNGSAATRHRSFYLIDRSVPSDFRRGKSWNWRDAILLERAL